MDDKPLEQVLSRDAVASGRYYIDYKTRRLFLGDEPGDRKVEGTAVEYAFKGPAKNVVIENLTVEKYANPAQFGAIHADVGSAGWTIRNCQVRLNHGAGIRISGDGIVEGSSVHHNGQIGIVGSGIRITIRGNDIWANNINGYDYGWEAGGTKFSGTEGLVVRNTCVHNNDGPGLWTDIDNINVLYEGNRVFENAGDGIKHEISYDATIRNNIVAHNGAGKHNWLWGSQILIQNSSNVEVYGNIVETGLDFGNAISIVHQKRGQGKYGPWNAVNNRVYDNRVAVLWPEGRTGMVADYQTEWFWENAGNSFDRNYYSVPRPEMDFWGLEQRFRSWAGIREQGMENHGTLLVEQRQRMVLSCERE